MNYINSIKYKIASRYLKNKSVSIVQAFLKASLVPLEELHAKLPEEGVILDLGCGEGILANLVAEIRPGCQIIGIDKDENRLEIAKKNASANAKFSLGDIFELDYDLDSLAAVILNDVVHHQAYAKHQILLYQALSRLRPEGLLILKEVDQQDRADVGMTRFFDSRLYPDDTLCFRGKNEWLDVLARLGVDDITHHRVIHPWPASRTVLFAKKEVNINNPIANAEQIGMDNLARSKDETIVFVTGASGFLGRHLCRSLLQNGLGNKPVRLIYLSRNPQRHLKELESATPLFGDLNDLPELKSALRGVDYVFNLAAEVKLTKGVDIWRNNYYGTLSLLEALDGIDLKRLVHASTMGAVDRTPSDDCSTGLTEDSQPNPLSEYGKTKLKAEQAVQESGLPYTILRVPWAYGSGMTPDTHVRFLTNGVSRKKLFSRIAFPGRVSVMTASDTVAALRLISTHDSSLNEVFFASDGNPIPLFKLFQRYSSVIGKKHTMLPFPGQLAKLMHQFRKYLPLQIQALASDVLMVDANKLFSLGFRPEIKMREGLFELARDQGHLPAINYSQPRRPISIVTGAAGGIGNSLSRKMHDEGHALLLIDKDIDKLKVVSESLNAQFLEANLSRKASLADIESYLEKNNLYIDWMVNNAGIGIRGSFVNLEQSAIQNIVEINCLAVMSLSHLFFRHSQKSHCGTLINIGSSSGFQPLPYMAAYAASKSFVQSFTLAVMGEVPSSSAVNVVLIDPSGTDTNFQATAGVKKNVGENLLSTEKVSKIIIESVYKGNYEVVIGLSGQAMALIARILPRKLQVKLWAKLMSKLR